MLPQEEKKKERRKREEATQKQRVKFDSPQVRIRGLMHNNTPTRAFHDNNTLHDAPQHFTIQAVG